jgi:6-phosphogluconolactonase
VYDPEKGKLTPAGTIAAGPGAGPHGPRYIEFHPALNVAYLVNELASTVSVFEFFDNEAATLSPAEKGSEYAPAKTQTLRLIQSVKTTPSAFPGKLNTCGRIAVDPTGRFVLVSNRGHNSLAVFRVNYEGALQGTLSLVGYCHTSGRTPRHFQFDPSGKFLIVANQDTDTIAVFEFNRTTGHLRFTGKLYDVPSPNFVCIQAPFARRITSKL